MYIKLNHLGKKFFISLSPFLHRRYFYVVCNPDKKVSSFPLERAVVKTGCCIVTSFSVACIWHLL